MATKENLIGLGEGPFLANLYGRTPVLKTVGGGSAGSALAMGGSDYLTIAVTGTSGLKAPTIGGDNGALLGDQFTIVNLTAAAIYIFAPNNALGSAVTFLANATSAAGTTGMSVAIGHTAIFYPATVSTWVGFKTSA